jgi:hypothetical protein
VRKVAQDETLGAQPPSRLFAQHGFTGCGKGGELRLFWIFLYHQGGWPISHRALAGRCGKFHHFLCVTAGIRSNPRGMNRQDPCISQISPSGACAASIKENRMGVCRPPQASQEIRACGAPALVVEKSFAVPDFSASCLAPGGPRFHPPHDFWRRTATLLTRALARVLPTHSKTST